MSPDPFVQAPFNTQSYNRYTYTFNNPLSFIDPSGYSSIKVRFNDQPISATIDEVKIGGVTIVPESKFTIPQNISGGHSGVVIINDETGLTRYREFGRYNGTSGDVRGTIISNIEFDENGQPTEESLNNIFGELSEIGENANSSDITIEYQVGGDFEQMVQEAEEWEDDIWNPLTATTCHTFCDSVVEAGGSDGPSTEGPLTEDNSSLVEQIRELHEEERELPEPEEEDNF